MIDIHSHILYNVDDGSDTLDESVALIKLAFENGYTDIVLTPHYINEIGTECINKDVLEHFENLKVEIKNRKININIHLGNEIYICDTMFKDILNSKTYTLANSKYVLIEFPMYGEVPYIIDSIYELKLHGFIPIIAHPERCFCFQNKYSLLRDAIKEGALFQINSGSIIEHHGTTAKKMVKKMLKEGLVSFVATDTHNKNREEYTNVIKIEKEIEKIVGMAEKNKLMTYNARCILANIDLI